MIKSIPDIEPGELIRRWLNWQAAGGSRRATIELRSSQLRRLVRETNSHPLLLESHDLAGWLAGHTWGPETLRSHRSALRSFYRWCWEERLIADDPSARLRRVKAAEPRPRPASEPVITAALMTADTRVHLMLTLAARCGLRRGEICRVHADDVVPDLTGWSLVVHGKGGRVRVVPMLEDTAELVLAAAAGGGWLFGNGRGDHLTAAHTGKLMRRELGDATAHQLRHRFATVAYRQSGKLEHVRQLLGHVSVATTQRYIAVDPSELRDVMRGAA